jgi:hypothetical protein
MERPAEICWQTVRFPFISDKSQVDASNSAVPADVTMGVWYCAKCRFEKNFLGRLGQTHGELAGWQRTDREPEEHGTTIPF